MPLPRSLRYGIPLALLTVFLAGCTSEVEDLTRVDATRYRAEFAVPLIDSKVSLRDLIGDVTEDVSVSVDPDGLLRFRYRGEVPAVGSEIIFARLEGIAEGIFLPITRRDQAAPFVLPNDVDLDEVRVSAGRLGFVLPNPYEQPVRVTLRLPDATLAGVPFEVSAEVPAYGGSGDIPFFANPDDPIDLSGYVLTFPGDSLFFEYDIEDLAGNDLPVAAGSVVTIAGLRFNYVEGYLGQEFYPGGRDTIAVDFFDAYLDGEIFFENPTVTMTLLNSFGVPARAIVEVLNVIDVNGNVIPIEGPAVEQGFDFAFPTVPGDTARTVFVFDRTNSNIDEVLSARPVALDYEVNALINPAADTESTGFLTDSGAYRALVEVELPLYGNATDFSVRDTFPLDLAGKFDDITDVTFRLTTKNGLPLDLDLTGTFLDSLDQPVAELSDGVLRLLASSTVDASGNPTGTEIVTNDLLFAGERLAAIRTAKRLLLTFTVSTTNGGTPFVRVTDEQELTVRLGARVTVARE